MSDIITKLERIKQTKHEIKEAINTKGAICETDCFREYPERILAIPSGGSGGGSSDSSSIAGYTRVYGECSIQNHVIQKGRVL